MLRHHVLAAGLLFATATGSAYAANQTAAVTFKNDLGVSVTSSSITHDGTLVPTPLATVPANSSDNYTNTGIGNVTSVHATYTAASGGKACKFDSAGNNNVGNTACVYTATGTSTGSTPATCTATVTSSTQPPPLPPACSFAVTWDMK